MTNRTLYLSFVAFAAAAAVNANTNAHAEMPGNTDLMQLIHEDLDQAQADFTLALAAKTEKKIALQTAKIDNVFGPLTVASNAETVAKVETASVDTSAKLDSLVLANAEYEIAKDAANIENPFNPRLPMAPSIIAFAHDEE
ncbi:hypothetical protein [Hyphococcus sp.]|uniref:hypothetical protein n=1 Tax=Hyphococcus sp. TaxID=2038636 RepID=UPI0020812CF6|nr:MAG: hypothetical protein DHS20C04_01470 [Marinicaulis sp.]